MNDWRGLASDHTRLGQQDLIAAEKEIHRERGTIPMSRLLQDKDLMTYLEMVANKLAQLGARDPVDEIELRWSPAGGSKTPVSLKWVRS